MNTMTFLLLPNAVAPEQCALIRADLERRGFAKTGEVYPAGYRDNDRLVLDDAERADALFEHLRARLPAELNIDGERWHLKGLNTRFRACRYEDGQSFCIHRDGAHSPSPDTRSWLTLQIYLNDAAEFRGGHTRFYTDKNGSTLVEAVAPRTGAAIVFDHRLWHDGERVTEGTKVVLRTDVMYERPTKDTTDGHHGYVWRAIVRRDGSIASAGRDGTVRTATKVHHLGTSSVIALCEDTRARLWCGTRDGRIAIIDGDALHRHTQHQSAILSLACNTRGEVAATTANGMLIATRALEHHHDGWAWAVTALGDTFATCGADGRVIVDSKTVHRFERPLRSITSDGPSTLIIGDELGFVHRLEVTTGRLATFKAHDGAVTSLAVHGALWASASEDQRARLWSGTDLVREFRSTDFLTSVAFTSIGELVWAGYDGHVCSTSSERLTLSSGQTSVRAHERSRNEGRARATQS